MNKRLMTIRDVSALLNVRYNTVLNWVQVGWRSKADGYIRLIARKNGKLWSITEEDLATFQEACRNASISDPPPEKAAGRKQRGPPDKARRLADARRVLAAMGI